MSTEDWVYIELHCSNCGEPIRVDPELIGDSDPSDQDILCTACGFEADEFENRDDTCSRCNGTGLDYDGGSKCPKCDGEGFYYWL